MDMSGTSLKHVVACYCLLTYFTSFVLAKTIDWKMYMPHTCTKDVNYTIPAKRIDLDIALWVNAIYDISEGNQEFGMQLDLLEYWLDPYMKFTTEETNNTFASLKLPKEVVDCIWKPDTLFQNAKKVKLYDETSPNIVYELVLPRGQLFRRSRFLVTVACPMLFHFYPMDTQVCRLQISLHRSRKNHVHLKWSENFNELSLDETPVNFEISLLPKTKGEKINAKVKPNVITEILYANFLFERSLSASLFNTYLPSLLVVCLSMVSFWIDVGAVPGRVTLGVTSILTLSTQIVRARSGLPPLNYMTAMDVWLLYCLIMVFLSLVEFTIASSHARRKAKSRGKEAIDKEESKKTTVVSMKEAPRIKSPTIRSRYRKRIILRFNANKSKKVKDEKLEQASNVVKDNVFDRVSRILFPLIMIAFSCFYWVYYLKMSANERKRILEGS